MSPDRRQRLETLLATCATHGAAPLAVRARRRCLRSEALTDMELRHNLLMAYGPLVEDLDALGLSLFYRLDLAAVVGRDRVDRVLGARYAQPTPRRRRVARFAKRRSLVLLVTLLLVVAVGLAMFNTNGVAGIAKLCPAPTTLVVNRSDALPAPHAPKPG